MRRSAGGRLQRKSDLFNYPECFVFYWKPIWARILYRRI